VIPDVAAGVQEGRKPAWSVLARFWDEPIPLNETITIYYKSTNKNLQDGDILQCVEELNKKETFRFKPVPALLTADLQDMPTPREDALQLYQLSFTKNDFMKLNAFGKGKRVQKALLFPSRDTALKANALLTPIPKNTAQKPVVLPVSKDTTTYITRAKLRNAERFNKRRPSQKSVMNQKSATEVRVPK
jgi:hypothetical protein